MIKFQQWVFVLLSAVFCSQAPKAATLTSDSAAGADSQSEELSYDSRSEGVPWAWNLSYDWSRSVQNDLVSGQISDITHQFKLGTDLDDSLLFGVHFVYSVTPLEHLRALGSGIELGYRPKIEKNKDQHQDQDAEDSRSFSIKTGLDGVSYVESIQGSAPSRLGRPPKPANLNEQISQLGWSGEMALVPSSQWEYSLSYTHYFYSKDPVQFLKNLDSPKAVARGVSVFGDTLSGFQSNQESLSVTFDPSEVWGLGLQLDLAHSATDGSLTRGGVFRVSRSWPLNWKTELGYEYSNSSIEVQNLGLFSLSREF